MKSLAGTRSGGLLAAAVLAIVGALAATAPAGGAATLSRHAAGAADVSGARPTCGGHVIRGWVCTFDDEFDSSTNDADQLLSSRWVVQRTSNSGYRTGPVAHPACYLDNAKNVWVAHGRLHLRARRSARPFQCLSGGGLTFLIRDSDSFTTRYSSGMVSSFKRFAQEYGRFEVRAKVPGTTAPGLQETLWLWPVNSRRYGAHGGSGEIDFAEFFSKFSKLVIPYIHYLAPPRRSRAGSTHNARTTRCAMHRNRFNTYTAVWSPGRIKLLVNHNVCLVDDYHALNVKPPAPFNQPFFIALTQALGMTGNAFNPRYTPLPATTQVDWVRVYARG